MSRAAKWYQAQVTRVRAQLSRERKWLVTGVGPFVQDGGAKSKDPGRRHFGDGPVKHSSSVTDAVGPAEAVPLVDNARSGDLTSAGAADSDVEPENSRRNLRYALGSVGALFTGLGFYALFALSGRLQAVLSSLVIIGAVLLLASMLRFERKRITTEFFLAILGVLTLPYAIVTEGAASSHATGGCTNGKFAHGEVPVHWIRYQSGDSAYFSREGESYHVFFPYLRWAGYFIPLPRSLCSYTVSFFAREIGPHVAPSVTAGWGYGLGVCDTINASRPAGFSLQYAFYQKSKHLTLGNIDAVNLPEANTYPNGVPQGLPYPLNSGRHQWTLIVTHNQVVVKFDDDYTVDQASLTGPGLPHNCQSSGVFLRVWGGEAQFSNFAVTPGT